jgi:hypothetical protein
VVSSLRVARPFLAVRGVDPELWCGPLTPGLRVRRSGHRSTGLTPPERLPVFNVETNKAVYLAANGGIHRADVLAAKSRVNV